MAAPLGGRPKAKAERNVAVPNTEDHLLPLNDLSKYVLAVSKNIAGHDHSLPNNQNATAIPRKRRTPYSFSIGVAISLYGVMCSSYYNYYTLWQMVFWPTLEAQMKIGLLVALLALPAHAERVKGYYKKNGTYVESHERSAPNAYRWDNGSYTPSQPAYNKSYYQPTRSYGPEWYQPNPQRFNDSNPHNNFAPPAYKAPPLEFRPPDFVKPRTYDAMGAIDAAIDGAARAAEMRRQEKYIESIRARQKMLEPAPRSSLNNDTRRLINIRFIGVLGRPAREYELNDIEKVINSGEMKMDEVVGFLEDARRQGYQ